MSLAKHLHAMLRQDVERIAEQLPTWLDNRLAIAAALEQDGQRFDSRMLNVWYKCFCTDARRGRGPRSAV